MTEAPPRNVTRRRDRAPALSAANLLASRIPHSGPLPVRLESDDARGLIKAKTI